MNKWCVVTILFLIVGCSKKYNYNEITSPKGDLYYLKNNMSLVNGKIYSDFGDCGEIKNGKKVGLWRTYYDNGQLSVKEFYKNDKLDGEYIEYFLNGRIKLKTNFNNGQINGDWETNYFNGNKKERKKFINNKKDGDHWDYSEDGLYYIVIGWSNDVKHGVYRETFDLPNRKVIKNITKISGYYQEGQKSGLWTEYWETGNVKTTANWQDGKLNGDYKHYRDRSVKDKYVDKGKYEDNKKVGFWTEHGILGLSEGNYVEGKKNGKWKTIKRYEKVEYEIEHYKNGELLFTEEFDKKDKLIGKYRWEGRSYKRKKIYF
tara:strand:+ start:181 stop:1131 length:951 start_codon:yes stop_codon:yes gene_type:complete